jgi:N,N'-diacetyllegionaminate synthase
MGNQSFHIQGHLVGADASPYIIAELGINHGGDLDVAKQMIDAAAAAGADAAKLQIWKTELFLARDSAYFGVLDDATLTESQIRELDAYAANAGITLFGSVFDEVSADLMESLHTPAYKIASGDLTHLPLLAHIARFGKPMIVSTGGSTMDEVQRAVDTIRGANSKTPIALLHCVSNYPTKPSDANLACMATMEAAFNTVIGFSDHTVENATAIASVALGAQVIEKHFTLDREQDGPDHQLSCDPAGLKALVDAARIAHQSVGRTEKSPVESDDFIPLIRRSVTAHVALEAGTIITREMLAVKRPGSGIQPDRLVDVVGMRTKRSLRLDETIGWDDVEGGSD